jgi:hypothetical protein
MGSQLLRVCSGHGFRRGGGGAGAAGMHDKQDEWSFLDCQPPAYLHTPFSSRDMAIHFHEDAAGGNSHPFCLRVCRHLAYHNACTALRILNLQAHRPQAKSVGNDRSLANLIRKYHGFRWRGYTKDDRLVRGRRRAHHRIERHAGSPRRDERRRPA